MYTNTILIFDAPCAEITLYDAVVSSPATSELNPALEQSCALAYCARQQMNTIDFSIFMLALIVEVRSSKALMAPPESFLYVPWHCPTFHSSPISGISRHTKVGGWEGVAFLFRPFGRLERERPTRNFCCSPFPLPLSLWHLFTPLLCLNNRYRRFPFRTVAHPLPHCLNFPPVVDGPPISLSLPGL